MKNGLSSDEEVEDEEDEDLEGEDQQEDSDSDEEYVTIGGAGGQRAISMRQLMQLIFRQRAEEEEEE